MENEEGKREMTKKQSSRFKSICVFCGSSNGNKASYQDAAIDLAKELVCIYTTCKFFIKILRSSLTMIKRSVFAITSCMRILKKPCIY